jgi:AcrR family transcriptional regulator
MSPPDAPAPKQDQGARSREEILDAAERLMGAHGYAATSISALAKASGLPPSSIYWHFGSKSGLLGAVMERGARRFFAAAAGAPELEHHEDTRVRLRMLVDQSAASMGEHAQFLRLHFFLLLGGDGEHTQNDVVMRVRAEATRQLGLGLRWVYQPWGRSMARRVGDELAVTAQTLMDGLFIAIDAGAPPAPPADHLVTALHTLAEQVRAGS